MRLEFIRYGAFILIQIPFHLNRSPEQLILWWRWRRTVGHEVPHSLRKIRVKVAFLLESESKVSPRDGEGRQYSTGMLSTPQVHTSPRKFRTGNGLEILFFPLRHSKDLYWGPVPGAWSSHIRGLVDWGLVVIWGTPPSLVNPNFRLVEERDQQTPLHQSLSLRVMYNLRNYQLLNMTLFVKYDKICYQWCNEPEVWFRLQGTDHDQGYIWKGDQTKLRDSFILLVTC